MSLRDYARDMRKAPTKYEARVWSWLRDRRFGAYKFRRQHPINHYVLDFYCAELKLAIELDGKQHEAIWRADYEHVRTQALAALGIEILRIPNELFRQDYTLVEQSIQ